MKSQVIWCLTNNVKTQGNCVIQIYLLRFQKHVLLISTPLCFYKKKKKLKKVQFLMLRLFMRKKVRSGLLSQTRVKERPKESDGFPPRKQWFSKCLQLKRGLSQETHTNVHTLSGLLKHMTGKDTSHWMWTYVESKFLSFLLPISFPVSSSLLYPAAQWRGDCVICSIT